MILAGTGANIRIHNVVFVATQAFIGCMIARSIPPSILREAVMQRLPRGSYILTYNGFGGRMPKSYEELRIDETLPSLLRLWRKHREGPARDFHEGVF